MKCSLHRATVEDVPAIAQLLEANRRDRSLFQQTEAQIRAAIGTFYVAIRDGEIIGSTALAHYGDGVAEILAVCVHPRFHGKGVGGSLIRHVTSAAREEGVRLLWLGTAKPGYFSRFGFTIMSRWRLPLSLLLYKLRLVFGQPLPRWLPAIFGQHVFMRLQQPT